MRIIVNRGSGLCVLCTGWNAERYTETCLTSSTTECTATQTLPQKQQWAMTTPTGGQEDAGRLKHKQDGQAGRWVCGMKRITKEDFSVSQRGCACYCTTSVESKFKARASLWRNVSKLQMFSERLELQLRQWIVPLVYPKPWVSSPASHKTRQGNVGL